MSLPSELRDELLSGYMDGTLSADETARVEQLLESDPQMSHELAELEELRGSLQAIHAADAEVRLPIDFSNRVLDAAVAAAQSEGVSENHPLVRLSEQPSGRSANGLNQSAWPAASLLVALAASIALFVFLWRPDVQENGPGDNQLAGVEDNDSPIVDPGSTIDTQSPDKIAPAIDNPNLEQIASNSNDADNRTEVRPVDPAAVEPQVVTPDVESVATNDPPDTVEAENVGPMPEGLQAIENGLPQLATVLLINVRLSDLGREDMGIERAMSMAGLESAIEKTVDSKLAGFNAELASQASDQAKLLYLYAPMKQIDRFYNQMVVDEDRIESISLDVAFGARAWGLAAREIHPIDATKIQQPVSFDLTSNGDQVRIMAAELQRRHKPLENRQPVPESAGPDVMSPVFVLIQ